ncbi:MAG: hypothetical protein NUW22_06050 [Acidobacteria bacterium]|nr:hypothetical protein [Acidobacteriota bacterium]
MLRDAFWTAAFLRDFVAGERPTLFKRLAGQPVVTSHVTAEPGRRPVAYDLYVVPSRQRTPQPALIVAHGFTPDGARDPRLQALCVRLARLGWLVMAPQFPQMRRYQLGLEDTDDLQTAVCALTLRPDVTGGRVGVLAFSFGVAPVVVGLTRESIRARTSFALMFGGCFDLRHAMKYALTGAYDQAGLSGRLPLQSEGDDRWKFLKGNLHLIPDSPTRDQFLRMLDARIADPSAPADPMQYSEAERVFFELMDNRDPDRFESLYASAAPYLAEWIGALSPCTVAARITTPMVIVHSDTDHRTHHSESLALSRAMPGAPPPLLAIVNLFSHVDISFRRRSIASFRREVLPSARLMWAVVLRLVRECRRPRP